MVDSPTARLSGARSLMNFEKVNTNLVGLRADLNRDRRDRQKFEEKRAKLLKKEERSLGSLRAATMNLRKIIGGVAGVSALSKFKEGDIGGGLQETGLAIAAFLPEIIGITSNIVVGGLATKGLIGGGTGMAGAPKGKAGLLALPLLALAPLLMGAGRNNQGNAPTSEFRREQEVRRTRKNIISSGDTERFGTQLDRFERILDGVGGKSKNKRNINQEMPESTTLGDEFGDDFPDKDGFFEDGRDAEGRDREGKLNIQNQIADFLSVVNPFRSIMDMFKSQEERMQDSKDRNAIFGTIFNGIKNLFRPKEAKAGTLDEFIKDGGVLPENNEESNEKVKEVGKKLMSISESFQMSDEGFIDFKSAMGSKKGKEMEDMMTNFLGVMKTEFVPSSDDKLESIASTFMNSSLTTPIITKKSLDETSSSEENIFIPMIGGSNVPEFQDTAALDNKSDSAVSEPDVDVEFKGSIDKFVNRLLLNIK